MKPTDQYTLQFPKTETLTHAYIPIKSILAKWDAQKKIYYRHSINLKNKAVESVLNGPEQKQKVPVIEHLSLERDTVIFDRATMTIYTGCIYTFWFWFAINVKQKEFNNALDICFAIARKKITNYLKTV